MKIKWTKLPSTHRYDHSTKKWYDTLCTFQTIYYFHKIQVWQEPDYSWSFSAGKKRSKVGQFQTHSAAKRAAVKCYEEWLSTSLCAHPLELQSMIPTMKVVTYKDNARSIDFFLKEKLDNSRKIRLEKWLKEIGVTTTLNLTNGKVAVPLEVLEKLRSQLSSKF